MISKSENNKTDYQSINKLHDQTKMNKKKEVPVSKKDVNLGLQKPGSNWERFARLVSETATNEADNKSIQVKRKRRKRNHKPAQKNNDVIPQVTNNNQKQITQEKKVSEDKGLTKAIAMDCEMVGIGNVTDSVINNKTDYQSINKLHDQTKMNKKKEVPVSKKDVNLGLQKPGSNWERFAKLVSETAANEADNKSIQVKRKRRNRNHKPAQKNNDAIPQVTNNNQKQITQEKKVSENKGLTKAIAMDCEMVGIGNGNDSMIARVSIVNKNGHCVYDKFVKPTEKIVDYRTAVSGIRPQDLISGEDFEIVQREVANILKSRILVGHGIHNDLSVLFLSHPKRLQRDTSRYKFFKKVNKGMTPSLKKLAFELLGVDIQSGEHNSVEDARAAMQLYQLYRRKWEIDIRSK